MKRYGWRIDVINRFCRGEEKMKPHRNPVPARRCRKCSSWVATIKDPPLCLIHRNTDEKTEKKK